MNRIVKVLSAVCVLVIVVLNIIVELRPSLMSEHFVKDDLEDYNEGLDTDPDENINAFISQTDSDLPFVSESDPAENTEILQWSGWQSASASKDLVLYTEKDISSEKVKEISAGSVCVITCRDDSWAYVRNKRFSGWTEFESLSETDTRYIADEANIGEISALSDEQKKKIDSIAKKYRVVGLTAAIIEDGQVAYTYEYGWSNKASKKKMTSDSKIRIASISKVFTAMNAMAARDLGALTIDGDIGDILGYKVQNRKYSDIKITLEHLMTHTSSMYDLGFDGTVKDGLTNKSTYRNVKPGTKAAWKYNNFSAGVIGTVTEKALGETLIDFSKNYFLDRMGIDAAYHAKWIKSQKDIASLYQGEKLYRSVKQQLSRTYHTTPGKNYAQYFGSLTISAKDMASVATILINDGQYNGEYYISPKSVAEMEKTYFELDGFDQCYILRKQENMYDGRTLYYHTGNAQGVRSFMSYDKESGDGIVVIATGMNGDSKDKKGIYKVCGEIANYSYTNILKEEI